MIPSYITITFHCSMILRIVLIYGKASRFMDIKVVRLALKLNHSCHISYHLSSRALSDDAGRKVSMST